MKRFPVAQGLPLARTQERLLPSGLVWAAVAVLLVVQAVLVLECVHRESLTFDEGDHTFAGYMMWKAGDYGLNPEHPPLVKLLATVPLLGEKMWIPPDQGREFKKEAYLDGRDWLARNDGASQRLVFRMRMITGLLAWGLSLVVFFATREWFGDGAALVAMTLVVFDPNIMAHSALVTTDVGVTLGLLASIWVFYRFVRQPTVVRLLVAGVVAGLLAATKHSGILLLPMLAPVMIWEVLAAQPGERARQAMRIVSGMVAIVVVAAVVLWAFYGFRYASRPPGLLSTSLAEYVQPLGGFDQAVVLRVGRLHLLPESYLIGLADVKRMAQFYPTFALGKVYTHGVWWYFPLAILIKTTLGLLALNAVALWAAVTGKIGKAREVFYVLSPGAVYLATAMVSKMDIGARHILPLYALAAIFAGAGAAALARGSKAWAGVGIALVAVHVASSMVNYPQQMAYANEAWGGAKNTHNLLSDANVDWAQQLYQVKDWQDRHPGEACWFAYFARPEVDPAVYGITCHALPNADTGWLGEGQEVVPPVVHGAVLISAGDLSGCEFPDERMNPYREFMHVSPSEVIEHAVFVYRGEGGQGVHVEEAAALSRAQRARVLLEQHQAVQALVLAREAVAIAPEEPMGQAILKAAEKAAK
jgi:hypothetical protein